MVSEWRWNHDGSIISSFCFLGRRFFPRCFLSNLSSSSYQVKIGVEPHILEEFLENPLSFTISVCLCKHSHFESNQRLTTFIRKFSNNDFFRDFYHCLRWWVSYVRNVKKLGVTNFVLDRPCPEEHPKSEKIRPW